MLLFKPTGWALRLSAVMSLLVLWLVTDEIWTSRSQSLPIQIIHIISFIVIAVYLPLLTIRTRHAAKRKLEESQEAYQLLLHHIDDGYYEINQQGILTQTNSFLCEMLQRDASALRGSSVFDLMNQDAADHLRDVIQDALQLQRPIGHYTFEHTLPSGEVLHLEASVCPVQMPDKSLTFRGIVHNVTEREQAQRALRDSEQMLREVIDAIPDMVILKDAQGRWVRANKAALDVYGIQDVPYEGMSPKELAAHSEVYRGVFYPFSQSLASVWEEGAVVRNDETVTLPTGEIVLDALRVPLFTEAGDHKGVLIVARDVTEKRAAEAIYLRSEKLAVAGQLAAGMAHEVRNPLTVLMGFLQLMGQTGEYKASYVSYMLAEIQRIEAILHDFLRVAKPTPDVYTVVDLAEVVSRTVDLMRAEALLRGIEVGFAITTSVPLMSGDPNRLRQVMINLMKNAIEAMPRGGVMDVRMESSGESEAGIHLSIADTGNGISEETLAQIGNPFFTTKESGTGLGMMLCQRIVQTHGGQLKITSEVGVGTTVDVWFPALHTNEERYTMATV
ncbi:MAG: PAS domain S-box protein [Firmicutes bacterium]|nr:PAS domain S-box protein [Bacillota bacterium]